MRCGNTDKRNEKYSDAYSDELFFNKIIKSSEPIILDVGAHIGESVSFFKEIFSKSKIYSFEPFPESFSKLEKLDYKNFFPINKAVYSSTGISNFHAYNMNHLSSLKKINKDSKDSIDYASKSKSNELKVKTITLDDFVIQKKISKIDLLKIDVQGAESDVLLGAKKRCLHLTKVITVEIGLFDFYEKKSSFHEIESLLKNFELYSIIRLSQNPMNFRTDWCEAVYINKKI